MGNNNNRKCPVCGGHIYTGSKMLSLNDTRMINWCLKNGYCKPIKRDNK